MTAVRTVTPAMVCLTLHAPAFADPGIEQPGEILTLGWPQDGEPIVFPEAGWRFAPGTPEQHWRKALSMRDVRRHLAAGCPAVAGSMKVLGY